MGDVGKQQPIGVYDSGVGGLTVVHWLREILPKEQIIYFGDTKRVPYGGRPPEEIIAFSRQILAFFKEQRVKFVIAACNTLSALALPVVAPECSLPVMGVIRSGAQEAVATTRNKRVGVMGTQATVNSHAYTRILGKLEPSISVYEQACPEVVPLIEAGHLKGDIIEQPLEKCLMCLTEHEIDTLILGCTHYPFLMSSIKRIVGSGIEIVDPAKTTAEEAKLRLTELDLLNTEKLDEDRYFVSGDVASFRAFITRLGYTHKVEHVDINKYTI